MGKDIHVAFIVEKSLGYQVSWLIVDRNHPGLSDIQTEFKQHWRI